MYHFVKKAAWMLAIVMLVSLFTAAAATTLFAMEPAEGSIFTTARYGTPKAIDGILDEGWNETEPNINERTGAGLANETNIDGEWRVMYDNAYLYFFISVKDDTLGDADFEYEAFGNYYTKNSVHIMFDMGYERATAYDANDFYYDVSCYGYTVSHQDTCDAIKYVKTAVVLTDDGYDVELRLDLDVYPDFKAEKGTCFGFELWMNDCLAPITGRLFWRSWSDEGDSVWRDPSIMGTIQLEEVPAGVTPTEKEVVEEIEYPGISNEDAARLLTGAELKTLGAVYTGKTNMTAPQGGGSKDIAVIVDGVRGGSDSAQYDTFRATPDDAFKPWFGVDLGGSYIVSSLVFWEGGMWNDGGWFGTAPEIQLSRNGEWYDYNASVTPEYPEDDATAQSPSYEPYIFALEKPVLCDGIRVIGGENQYGNNVSCCEIEVWGYAADASVEHDTLDGKTPATAETDPIVTDPIVTDPIVTESGTETEKATEKTETTGADAKTESKATADNETEEGTFPWWIIVVGVAICAIAVAIIVVKKKKK